VTEPDHQPTGGRRRSAIQRRERIITAARELFARQGFHGTGVAQIAQLSGVLVGQLYRDFSGKEELIAAIVERDIGELLDDPDLADAVASGEARQLNAWLRHFIARGLDQESRSVLTDILSEATRNPKIAEILQTGYRRLQDRLVSAAFVWIPDPAKDVAREELADLILTAGGAIQHRQIFGLPVDDRTIDKLVDLIDRELALHSQAG